MARVAVIATNPNMTWCCRKNAAAQSNQFDIHAVLGNAPAA
jgi:hypothetical protein